MDITDICLERLREWQEYGVVLDGETIADGRLHICINVPLYSDYTDNLGNELSGFTLAKCVQRSLGERVVLEARVRQERWTVAKAGNTGVVTSKCSWISLFPEWFGG